MRAFMSSGSGQVGRWRQGQGTIPQWDFRAQAARELARILAETERETGSGGCLETNHADLSLIRDLSDRAVKQRAYKPSESIAWQVRKALAESLAAVTADGGVLDALATFHNEPDADTGAILRAYRFNHYADPVILAAQRDLAVLSTYAQGVRA